MRITLPSITAVALVVFIVSGTVRSPAKASSEPYALHNEKGSMLTIAVVQLMLSCLPPRPTNNLPRYKHALITSDNNLQEALALPSVTVDIQANLLPDCKKEIYNGTELEQYMEQARNHPPCRLHLVGRIEISKPLVLDGIVLEGLINPALGFNSAESPYLPMHSGRVYLSGPSAELTAKAYSKILLPPDGLPVLAASDEFQGNALLIIKTNGHIEKLILKPPVHKRAVVPFQKTSVAHYLELQHIFIADEGQSDTDIPFSIQLADNNEVSNPTFSRQVSSTNSRNQGAQAQTTGTTGGATASSSPGEDPPEDEKITSYDPKPPADSTPDVQSKSTWIKQRKAEVLKASKKRENPPNSSSIFSRAKSKFESKESSAKKQPPPVAPKPKKRGRVLPAVTQQAESNPEATALQTDSSPQLSTHEDPLDNITERLQSLRAENNEAAASLARAEEILNRIDEKIGEDKNKGEVKKKLP